MTCRLNFALIHIAYEYTSSSHTKVPTPCFDSIPVIPVIDNSSTSSTVCLFTSQLLGWCFFSPPAARCELLIQCNQSASDSVPMCARLVTPVRTPVDHMPTQSPTRCAHQSRHHQTTLNIASIATPVLDPNTYHGARMTIAICHQMAHPNGSAVDDSDLTRDTGNPVGSSCSASISTHWNTPSNDNQWYSCAFWR